MTTYNIYVRVTNKMEIDTVDKFDSYTNTLSILETEDLEFKIFIDKNVKDYTLSYDLATDYFYIYNKY